MPKILERLVQQLMDKGKSKEAAYAIATKSLQRSGNLKKGTQQATAKGIRRGNMTPEERSNDRASAKSKGKHRSFDFKYNATKNTSKLKRGR